MHFIYDEAHPLLSLDDIEDSQFFINITGCLCHKVSETSYCTITNSTGRPYACVMTIDSPKDCTVLRKLATVKKIVP